MNYFVVKALLLIPDVLATSGYFRCQPSVIMGRPSTRSEMINLIKDFDKVKGVGVGHSWWQQQFCAGANDTAIQIVTTEFTEVLDM